MRDAMWIRLGLCGSVAGVVWNLLSSAFLYLVAPDFMDSVHKSAPYPAQGGGFFYGIDVVMGIWAIWLYAAIAPRHGTGPRTAAIAAGAWWTIKSLQSAKWVGLGFVPPGLGLVPLAAMSLVAALVAVGAGARLYDKVGPR